MRSELTPFSIFLALFFLAWLLRTVLLMPVERLIHDERLRTYFGHALHVALWVLPVLVYLLAVDRANPLVYLRFNTLPQGRRLVMSSAIVAVFVVLGTASALLPAA